MEEKKTISVKVTTKDMFLFMLRHTYSGYSGVIGIIISVGAFILFLLGYGDGDVLRTGALIMTALLFTVVNPILIWFKSYQQVKLTPMFQEPIEYTFTEEWIEITQKEEQAVIEWESICKLVNTSNSIILYVSKVRAFILPKIQFQQDLPEITGYLKQKVDSKFWKGKPE